ncbi:MAG: Gfo/Idh/MocA family oxidoreductase [Lachnospiraceae bacterium]|nr:Gfo/Idh/MocA family oxidoreductase [Lachnospiraceae bacterium]
MNVAVIGLGSMGKRRIRLIKETYPDYIICGVDGREDRRDEASEQFGINCYAGLDSIKESIDCVFVCTSPLSHNMIIKDALANGYHVFTELNLVDDGYEANIRTAKDKNLTLFLSSTFLYREEIRYLRSKIDEAGKWNYVYHIGQYLPDWHPWENYKDFFLGDKRTNGCREILAIELPWLISTFGDVKDINAVSDKMTDLNIDYNDNFVIQLSHDNGNKGCLIVDVVSPVAVRKFEVYSEGRYMAWNGTPDSLFEFNPVNKKLECVSLSEKAEHMEGYSSFVVENAYKNEIKEFFNVLLDKCEPVYGFEQDKKILELIDRIGA